MLRPCTSRPVRRFAVGAVLSVLAVAGCSSTPAETDRSTAAPTSVAPTSASSPESTAPMTPPRTSASRAAGMPAESSQQASLPAPRTSARAASGTSSGLPLRLSTGNATQVVTVVADRGSDTRATVARWTKSGSRWRQVGASVDAYVGSGGIGQASEGSTRTPAGSWTLTQAFGRDADPGTSLPYFRTTPDDYWMSSPGPNYNTHQRCGSCGYDNDVNERLHDITPEYDHAVVIDYNTANAPGGIRPGAGSAFFLHIADGAPTAGCVALPRDDLVRVLTWLEPAKHPRILIGVV